MYNSIRVQEQKEVLTIFYGRNRRKEGWAAFFEYLPPRPRKAFKSDAFRSSSVGDAVKLCVSEARSHVKGRGGDVLICDKALSAFLEGEGEEP